MVDPEPAQGVGHVWDAVGRPRGIRARGAQDRAALEVDTGEVVDAQLDDVVRVALGQPAEAVVTAEHAQSVIARLDGRRRDHRVDPGGRPAAYENRQRPLVAHWSARPASHAYPPIVRTPSMAAARSASSATTSTRSEGSTGLARWR